MVPIPAIISIEKDRGDRQGEETHERTKLPDGPPSLVDGVDLRRRASAACRILRSTARSHRRRATSSLIGSQPGGTDMTEIQGIGSVRQPSGLDAWKASMDASSAASAAPAGPPMAELMQMP